MRREKNTHHVLRYSTSHPPSTPHIFPLHSTSLLCTPRHPSALHVTPLHSTSPLCTLRHPLYSTLPLCTPRHLSALHVTPLHSTSPLCTPCHPSTLHSTPLHPTYHHKLSDQYSCAPRGVLRAYSLSRRIKVPAASATHKACCTLNAIFT